MTVDLFLREEASDAQVIAHLEPLQQRYAAIREDEGYLESVLARGAGTSTLLHTGLYGLHLSVLTGFNEALDRMDHIAWCISMIQHCHADTAEEAATRTLDNVREVG